MDGRAESVYVKDSGTYYDHSALKDYKFHNDKPFPSPESTQRSSQSVITDTPCYSSKNTEKIKLKNTTHFVTFFHSLFLCISQNDFLRVLIGQCELSLESIRKWRERAGEREELEPSDSFTVLLVSVTSTVWNPS